MNTCAAVQTIAQRFAARDLRAMLAISDARKAEDAATKARMRANVSLEATLRAQYARQGRVFSWEKYFTNLGWF